jgi:hypothetical protein
MKESQESQELQAPTTSSTTLIHPTQNQHPALVSKTPLFFLLSALLTCILAGSTSLLVSHVFRQKLAKITSFSSPRAAGFKSWRDTAISSNRQFYMYVWSIENPDEFVQQGAKLRIKENGPFVYDQRHQKVNVTFDGDQVSYQLLKTFAFNSSATMAATNGTHSSDVNELFTVVDLLFFGELPRVGPNLWRLLNIGKTDVERMFTKLTVRDIKDGFVTSLGVSFPGLQPDTLDTNVTTMLIGTKRPEETGRILRWRGQESLRVTCPWGKTAIGKIYCPGGDDNNPCCDKTREVGGKVPLWKWPVPGVDPMVDDHANDHTEPNVVNGTDGSLFGPFPKDHVQVFVDAIYRHCEFIRTAVGINLSGETVDGIPLDRYEMPLYTPGRGNQSESPYNAAFYMYDTPHGISNGTMYEKGAPVYMSLPHMLDVSKEATERIERGGQHPNVTKHQTYLGVEPNTGQTFFSRSRMQVNVLVRPLPKFGWFQGMMEGNTYVPLAWFSERASINAPRAKVFRDGLNFVNSFRWWIVVVSVAGAGGLLVAALLSSV